jgi:hypothetical protein
MMNWLLDPYRELRTYRVAGYLLLGLPLGVVEFVAVVTGLSMGLGLLITLLGVPVLVLTFLGARAGAGFERELARTLLDAPMPSLQTRSEHSTGIFWSRLRELVTDRDTWASLAFLLLRLPLGIIDFTVVVTIVGLALGGFAQPILFAVGPEPTRIGEFVIDTFAESLIYLPISIVFLITAPRLLLAWSTIPTRIATAFLGRVGRGELKDQVTGILSRTGGADAFRIFDELRLRIGRGPFLNFNRVEAALLALESTGHIVAYRDGGRTRYTLAH